MPRIDTQRADVRALQGVHLYHYGLSTCSQRVRIALAEKEVSWTGHPVDLLKQEHASPEFLSINPDGLVPVLVHDGQTFVESLDILTYVEEAFGGMSLSGPGGLNNDMRSLLAQADALQADVKVLTHEFLLRGLSAPTPERVNVSSLSHKDPALLLFRREYAANGETWRDWTRCALQKMDCNFTGLDELLARQGWLTGPNFGLVDIAQLVNVHRMSLIDWPFGSYPRLKRWFEKIQARESYAHAVCAHEPAALLQKFAAYRAQQSMVGMSVTERLSEARKSSPTAKRRVS
jgi:glutathione S-transferase